VAEAAVRPRTAWKRVSRGLLVLGFGVFLLLNTTGRLPWWFWVDLLAWWPVLLIALGVRLLFDRTRFAWGVLLSPILILGTMAFVARQGGKPYAGVSEPVRAEGNAETSRWRLDGNLVLAEIDVSVEELGGHTLLQGTAAGERGGPEVRTVTRGEASRVEIGSHTFHGFTIIGPRRLRARWSLKVDPGLPLDLDLDAVATRGRLDLAGAPFRSARLRGAFQDLEFVLGRPEEEVTLDFEGAFSSLHLVVPRGVPVRVEQEGALNSVDRALGGEGHGYRVRIEGAFNRLELDAR
jgi:hypothetical protein